MPSIKYLEENGVVFYPVVHERGVRDSDGIAISTKMQQTSSALANLSMIVSMLDSVVQTLQSNEAIIAWDGSSTPNVSLIPEGVTVEYGGQTYEGELEAGTSTSGKTYMVGEEDSETVHRYISVLSGDNYIWFDYGSTDIDLSDYQRKDDEVWLTKEEFERILVKDPTKTYNVYEEEEVL